MVGGISKNKAGKMHLNLPVYKDVAEARKHTEWDATVLYIPPSGAAEAIMEGIDA